MAITTTSVTGPLLDANDQPYSNVKVIFTPAAPISDDANDTTIPQTPVEVVPDGAGDFSIALAPSDTVHYKVELQLAVAYKTFTYRLGLIYVPVSGPVPLEELLPVYAASIPTNEILLAALSAAVAEATIAGAAAVDAVANVVTLSYYEDNLADLPTASGVIDGVFAIVLTDPTPANRGIYQEQSDAWVKTADLPPGFSLVGADVKAAYEGEADTNAFTDSEKTNVANLVTATGTPDILGRVRVEGTSKDYMKFWRSGEVSLLDGGFRNVNSDNLFDVTDEQKRRLFSVMPRTVEVMGGKLGQTNGGDIYNITDAAGNVVFRVNTFGDVSFSPENLPASTVIDLGATSVITNVQRVNSALFRYTGTAMGTPANYLVGTVLSDPAHVYAGDAEIEVHLDYGQSWRADLLDTDFDDLDGKSLPTVYALRDKFGALYTSFRDTLANGVIDLARVEPEVANPAATYDQDNRGGVSIGRVSALVYQHFCKDNNQHVRGVLTAGGPRPGSWWSEDGNPGATGDYLAPGSPAWTAQATILSKIEEVLPQYNVTPKFAALGWTHGAPSDAEVISAGATYFEELEEMMAAYDALNLRGGPFKIYSDQTPATGLASTCRDSMLDQVIFAANNPSRVHLIGPRYPYAFRNDNIHHNALAITQIGELEGYVKYKTLRKGETWTPLKITNASIAGDVVTLTISDPFGTGVLAQDTTQIEAADDLGFLIKDDGVTATISSIVITGLSVAITLSATPVAASSIEVSYAWYRTTAVADDPNRSGVWGNIKQVGPASKIFTGATIDTWLCSYKETITA